MKCSRKNLMPFGAGDYVVDITDPRHVARVNYVEGLTGEFSARVKWLGTGWISELPTRTLRKITREEAMTR